ncbi:MAG: hypothetical protein ACK4OE_16645 [Acidovorax sp.]|uniref:hypothetical protein n=1 Tax=Acidovorax sp. TaxID=1872122 RepID=UPI0039191598
MIVPSFWAEARRQIRRGNRQITVRRWGWSDTSEADAQAMAEARADEALALAQTDNTVERRERKVAYNGAQGVPIREEVLERHGDTVITRNAYGAKCLNTPDVLFADVDFDTALPRGLYVAALCLLAAVVLLPARWLLGSWGWLAFGLVAVLGTAPLAHLLQRLNPARQGGPQAAAMARLRAFLQDQPAWAVRVYRTPAGLRLLATQGPVAPGSEQAQAFFNAVGADPLYVRMCENQHCFRARLTGKPWRMGIEKHLRPRPGVWPVSADRLPVRQAWVRHYDTRAQDFAACAWIETVGSGVVHPAVQPVVDLHDNLSQPLQPGKPLA